jgi:hypothetical protein
MNPNPRITPMLTYGFSENSRIDVLQHSALIVYLRNQRI